MSIKIPLVLLTLLITGKNFEDLQQDEAPDNASIPLHIYDQVNWKQVITNEETANAIIAKLRSTTTTPCPVVTMATPETQIECNRTNEAVSYLNAIVDGSIEELQAMPYGEVKRSLKSLTSVELPLRKSLIIWKMFKRNRKVERLAVRDWETIGSLILKIPENDLFRVDVSNWEIVDYLGTLSIMTSRKAMILAYSFRCKFPNVLKVPNFVNRIKGLMCGFSTRDLSEIPVHTVLQIKPEAFNNLWACSNEQIQVLLELCMSTHVYGYIETWDESTLERLGFLILGLTPDQVKTIPAETAPFLSERVLSRMDRPQIRAFTGDQVSNFNDAARTAYNHKLIVENSGCPKTSYPLSAAFFICILHWLLRLKLCVD